MLRRLLKGVSLGALLVAQPLLADVAQLKQLVDAQRFEDAYQYSLNVLPDYEGDPAFDLQYGIAAIDSGHVGEGLFALERVLLVQPDNQQARLEQARGLFLLGRFEQAETLFKAVKATRPPAAVIAHIDHFLALIASNTGFPKTRFTNTVALFAGYDDNINSAPDDQTRVVTLNSEALGRGDQLRQFQLNSHIDHSYSRQHALFFDLSAELRDYDTESSQNYRNLNLGGGHRWLRGKDQFQLAFNLQKFALDDQSYRDMVGVSGMWSHQYSQRLQVRVFAGHNALTYDTLGYKDSSLTSGGVSWLYAAEGEMQPLWFATLFAGRERPDVGGVLADAEAKRQFSGANVGVQLRLNDATTLTGSLVAQNSDYRGVDWIYGVKRKDDYAALNLELEWALNQQWHWITRYNYTRSDSNIELYDYDRHQILLGLRYAFN